MSRLITLGCSHTICEGLENPHKDSWPSILSKKFNKKLINLAENGGSNRSIQHNVYKFKFENDDVVIILWTYPDRYHFFRDKDTHTGLINSWGKGRSELWFKDFHTEYNEKFDNQTIVNQVNLFLKDKNIKLYNILVSSDFKYYFDISEVDLIDIDFTKDYLEKYKRGIDGWHLGIDGNYNFAMDIYNNINKKELL